VVAPSKFEIAFREECRMSKGSMLKLIETNEFDHQAWPTSII